MDGRYMSWKRFGRIGSGTVGVIFPQSASKDLNEDETSLKIADVPAESQTRHLA
jgi:hypothetical protein